MLWAFFVVILLLELKIMADISKLTAAVAKLSTDVDALIALNGNAQPAIDIATAAVEAVDAKVVAATPPAA
jgi:hypothetical protein